MRECLEDYLVLAIPDEILISDKVKAQGFNLLVLPYFAKPNDSDSGLSQCTLFGAKC